MNPQYIESNSFPYGSVPMGPGYNQMPPQPGEGGNQAGHAPQYNITQSPTEPFGHGPPPPQAYPQHFNPNMGKVGTSSSNMPPLPSSPQQHDSYQNGSVANPPPMAMPPPHSRMQAPFSQPSYHNPNVRPNQQPIPPQRPMGNSNLPQQLVNQMGSMQLNSGGPLPPRPSLINGPGVSQTNNLQPVRLPPPSMMNSPNAYGSQEQFSSAQQGNRPPMIGQQQSLPGQQHLASMGQHYSSSGQQLPPSSGQQHPSIPAQQHPPLPGQQRPPLPGQQQPPLPGQQQPPLPGQQQPPLPGQQQPPLPGQQHPPLPGQQQSLSSPPFGSNQPPNRNLNAPFPASSSTNFTHAQPLSQIQDYGHRLPSNQPPLSSIGGPGGNPPLLSSPPFANVDSINGVGYLQGNVPAYPGQQGSHQFSIGSTPPPPGPNSQMQPPYSNQYGAGPTQQKYPPSQGAPPPGPHYMGANQGYNPMHQQGPASHMPPQVQPQQQRRLDPEMMPSPIQVIEDDRKSREGEFCTNLRGQVPPLITTKFVTRDQGNCNPRFMRSTMYTVPCNPDMLKQTSIPFVLSISAFAKLAKGEIAPPVVQATDCGPTRCARCKAYMCPYMQFIDGGRRFQCNFCRATTEVPPEYFAHLDHTGQRVDKYERPELCLGSYEFIATKDYCKNNVFPLPPAFIFIIDVSYNNIKSGVVQLLCQNMKTILAHLPRESSEDESQIKVGFITYSNTVQFYNLKSCLSQPQVLVVPDVQDMFMPLLDGFLVGLDEAAALVDNLMEQIPLMNADSRETETILGPVIKAGLEALKAADRAGKLFVFHSSLPIAEAPGKLKNRDDRKLLGSDKEKTVLAPQIPFYNQLGQECVAAGCSVDLFTFPNAYIDIATIGQVSRLSGGQIHKYTYFVADVDGERLIKDLCLAVSSQVAFDAIMRVRTSTGIRPVEFYGNYYMSNTTDVELAAVDTDKAICVEIKHDDKLTDEEAVYIQTAILYTSVGGQRKLRVHNLSLSTCTQMADLYKNCELDTLMNFYSKFCLRQLCEQTPKQVKESLINKVAQGLACYRKHCASPSSAGQLILPECMKLLPLYANCLMKNDAIAGGSDMTTDDRSFAMHFLNGMDVNSSLGFIYPRLIPLHDLDYNSLTFPNAMRSTIDKLKDDGIYLLENGLFMFMWIGMNADSKWLQNVFGVHSAAQVDVDQSVILELDNPISQGVRQILNEIREERRKHLKLIVIPQRDKLEVVFRHFLVEDKGIDGSPSYVDFLCHVHKEIRNLLS